MLEIMIDRCLIADQSDGLICKNPAFASKIFSNPNLTFINCFTAGNYLLFIISVF